MIIASPTRFVDSSASCPSSALISDAVSYEFLPPHLPPSFIEQAREGEEPCDPAYRWRGFLLDSSRTFWPVPLVCEVLELMHRYGFNRLHWHLTDNSGWRIPIPGYPALTEVGGRLPRLPFDDYDNVPAADLERYQHKAPFLNNQGYYDHDDIARILARAEQLGIDVMPEIDLPGHAEAVTTAYPHLGNPSTVGMSLADVPGARRPFVRNNLLWPSPESFAFITTVLETVCDLFPSSTIHIGGDECDFEYWETNPQARAWMDEHGVTDGQSLQAHFMNVAASVLASRGRRPGVWDEAVETGLPQRSLVFGWRESVGVETARRSGHPWVFCDADLLYLNRVEQPDRRPSGSTPVAMDGAISVERILSSPLPHDTAMVGIQSAAWCEFITDRSELYRQILPRLIAVGARAQWGNSRQSDALAPLVEREASLLAEAGYGV